MSLSRKKQKRQRGERKDSPMAEDEMVAAAIEVDAAAEEEDEAAAEQPRTAGDAEGRPDEVRKASFNRTIEGRLFKIT